MTIEFLISDCDAASIDSEPISRGTLARALKDAGVFASDEELHRRFLRIFSGAPGAFASGNAAAS